MAKTRKKTITRSAELECSRLKTSSSEIYKTELLKDLFSKVDCENKYLHKINQVFANRDPTV